MAYWSDDEIRILRNMAGGKATKAVIARTLGRSQRSVKFKAEDLGLSLRRLWAPREEQYLTDNIGFVSMREIARRLGRDETSVRRKAGVLGLDGSVTRTPKPGTNPGGSVASTATLTDDDYVALCLEQGGFPVALSMNGQTVWAYPRRAA